MKCTECLKLDGSVASTPPHPYLIAAHEDEATRSLERKRWGFYHCATCGCGAVRYDMNADPGACWEVIDGSN